MFELWRTWQPVALHDGPTIGPAPAPPPAVKPPAGPAPAEPAVKGAPKPVGDKPAVGTKDTVQLQSAASAQTALELTAKAKTLTEKLGVLQGKMVELLKDVPNAQKVAKERELKAEVVNKGLQDFLAHANMDPNTRKKVEAYLAAIPAKDLGTRALVVDALNAAADRGQLNGALITQLSLLSDPRTPLAPGIDRQRLVRETLQELAEPTYIAQGGKMTCAGTNAQMALSLHDPARYVQAMRLLASPTGDASAVIPDLKRPANQDLQAGDDRRLTVSLMTTALMSYATGGSYDVTTDKRDLFIFFSTKGLDGDQQKKLIEGVLGIKVDFDSCLLFGEKGVLQKMQAATERGTCVPVELNWGGDGHAVLFMGTAKDENGREYAVVMNPQGKKDKIRLDVFQSCLRRAFIPEEGQKPIARPPDWNADVKNIGNPGDWKGYKDYPK